jgi:hypothetical protein
MRSIWSKLAWVLVGCGVSVWIWKAAFRGDDGASLDSSEPAQSEERLSKRRQEVSSRAVEEAGDRGDEIASATRSGSFARIKARAMEMPEEERQVYFLNSVLPLKTKLGLENDLVQKREILMTLSASSRPMLMKRLMRLSGSDLDATNAVEVAGVVSDGEWSDLIVGKCQSDPAGSFLIGSQLEGEKRGITNRTSIRQYLEQGSVAAGEFVQSLKAGPDRNDAVGELVKWLVEKGDLQAAKEWSMELPIEARKPF